MGNKSFQNIRLGERKQNNDGQWMEIIKYNNSQDIDIKFDDGSISKNIRYERFKKGTIQSPNKYSYRLGLRKQNNKGDWMEIVRYENSNDIDVKFDLGGTVLKHRKYLYFDRGCLRNPLHYLKRIGRTIENYQGLKMTLIDWNTISDVKVQFEDGTILDHQDYRHFKSGRIRHPKYAIATKVSKNEFVFYYYLKSYGFKHYDIGSLKDYGLGLYSADLLNSDINLAIEYDGFYHKYRDDLKKNKAFKNANIDLIRIREPKLKDLSDGMSVNFKLDSSRPLNSSLTKTIIEVIDYINSKYNLNIDNDIDVDRDKEDILSYYAKHTDYQIRNTHLGQRVQNNQGLWLTVIEYRDCNDIDLKFDIDGAIIQHKNHTQIIRGHLPHPTRKRITTDRTGEINKNISGYEMKILNYRGVVDIDVIFTDDNSVVRNRQYSDFKRGAIKHP